jgi:hypothetical protein
MLNSEKKNCALHYKINKYSNSCVVVQDLESVPELQIEKNSCQTLGPASKRILPDLLFFRNFLIFHFQYSMIKGTILKP